ncbi:MAG: hypothetical protein U5O39_01725 [Gammaproteobacteria bacterium]|nr:hypothetical protein [Gammaproteobacteria bacterium]
MMPALYPQVDTALCVLIVLKPKSLSVLVDVIACENPELLDTHLSGQSPRYFRSRHEGDHEGGGAQCHPAQGLRLEMDQKVFRLEGQVRWTRQDGEISMGIKLDPESADYALWEKLFELSAGDSADLN